MNTTLDMFLKKTKEPKRKNIRYVDKNYKIELLERVSSKVYLIRAIDAVPPFELAVGAIAKIPSNRVFAVKRH